jgi:hypothetical protein
MDEGEQAAKRGAIVKRRWAIVPGRGGRAAILATVGAIALGSAPKPPDPGPTGAQSDDPAEIVTAADDDQT